MGVLFSQSKLLLDIIGTTVFWGLGKLMWTRELEVIVKFSGLSFIRVCLIFHDVITMYNVLIRILKKSFLKLGVTKENGNSF